MKNWTKSARTGFLILLFFLEITLFAAEQPLLRVGIMTDTHVAATEESCRKTRKAFLFFKEQNIDLMIHVGDIADRHYTEGYKLLRRYINEIFSEKKPKELWAYAIHDAWIALPGDGKTKKELPDWEKALQQTLQIPNAPYDKLVINGYLFLIFPQVVDYAKMEKTIQDAVRDCPGKPIFVVDHVPPYRDTEKARPWGYRTRRKILDKYPQVINLCGHIHHNLRDENCIWQGNFTSINCGCMIDWRIRHPSTSITEVKMDGVIIMDVFSDKVVLHCYSLNSGKEIRPDHPWCIPLPFDPKTAPYNPERRLKNSPKPYFAQGAYITMKADQLPFHKLTFTIPEAKHPDRCYLYRFTLNRKNDSGAWERVSYKDSYAGFFYDEVPETFSISYDAASFEKEREYQLSVVPVNFYGGTGNPLELTFRAPEPASVSVPSDGGKRK